MYKGFGDMIKEAGLQDILSYTAGYLNIRLRMPEEMKKRFQELGFSRVYPAVIDFEQVVLDLRRDLELEKGGTLR